MLVEEAIEKLTQARDTADPEERAELIDEVIEALEEGKIEPAEDEIIPLEEVIEEAKPIDELIEVDGKTGIIIEDGDEEKILFGDEFELENDGVTLIKGKKKIKIPKGKVIGFYNP